MAGLGIGGAQWPVWVLVEVAMLRFVMPGMALRGLVEVDMYINDSCPFWTGTAELKLCAQAVVDGRPWTLIVQTPTQKWSDLKNSSHRPHRVPMPS
eukprot:6459428-Amphidinium_carterae.1